MAKQSIHAPAFPHAGITFVRPLDDFNSVWLARDGRAVLKPTPKEKLPLVVVKFSQMSPSPQFEDEEDYREENSISQHPTLQEIIGEADVIDAIHRNFARNIAKNDGALAPGIIHLLDVGQFDTGMGEARAYHITPYIPGKNLFQAVRPINSAGVFALGVQMLDIAYFIHKAGYLHCDMTLQNQINGGSHFHPRLTVTDFTLARKKDQPLPEGEVSGNLEYMSKLTLQGKHDPKADLYAIGVCMYKLLTGYYPRVIPASASHTKLFRAQLATFEKQLSWRGLRINHPFFEPEGIDITNTILTSPEKTDILEARNAYARASGRPEVKKYSSGTAQAEPL